MPQFRELVLAGATSTGLLLLRMADPDNKTGVLRDFTFKQIFHVLITGGGFFDVLVPIPLCATSRSAWPLLLTSLTVIGLLLVAHPATQRCCRGRRAAPNNAAPVIKPYVEPASAMTVSTPSSIEVM